ncbi:C40 family peptidase [Luedemannella flava]|uniref:C40 family peptidase n=1 Tax=Luedemannella flava TaxID=349316 RepID=A0ABP4YCH2_9ACTN
MGRVLTWTAAAFVGLVVLIGAAAGGVVAAIFGGDNGNALGCLATMSNPDATPAGLSAEQTRNTAVIIGVGQRMKVPARGWVIAVATALQESNLINLGDLGADNDHDSLGLFQQRPSEGWGTPEQIMNPEYAAGAFYAALRKVTGWVTMPLTEATQRVQRSAFPNAYAKHEARAATIVAAFTGAGVCDGGDGDNRAGVPLPSGFTLPADTPAAVVTAIVWALAQRGTPYTFGGDCTAPHSGVAAHQCDCSSLVQQAYRAGGVRLPRTTSEQVHAGTAVSGATNLKPGDLILIPGSDGTMSNPGHVGLYIGSGLLVQAPHTGDVVKISRVSEWVNQIAAIRRIVPS